MQTSLDHATLKARQRAIRADFPETMGLRTHRSISWGRPGRGLRRRQ